MRNVAHSEYRNKGQPYEETRWMRSFTSWSNAITSMGKKQRNEDKANVETTYILLSNNDRDA